MSCNISRLWYQFMMHTLNGITFEIILIKTFEIFVEEERTESELMLC